MHPADGRVILITGTSRGIGRYLAQRFIDRGYTVFGCSRQPSDVEHERYFHSCLDITDEPAVKRLFGSIRRRHQRLDVLINNAGIASMNLLLTTPIEKVRQIFDTNFVGTFLFTREAIKLMRPRRFGRIINFSTIAVPLKLAGESAYAASKAAVISLTEVAAKECAAYGITVNALGPPPIDTDLLRGVPPDNLQTHVLARLAIPRFGECEEIFHAVEFYISEKSGMITGQVIYFGGV